MKRIASIYFDAVEAARPLYGGYYKIPAVARGGEPTIITIEDKVQRSSEPSPDGRSRITQKYLITAREIANDIVGHWISGAMGMTPACRPGIWIVRDEVALTHPSGALLVDGDNAAQSRPATDEEKAAMWAEDYAASRAANDDWAEYLIQQGDLFAEDPKQRRMIGPLNKKAARFAGKERAWLAELKDNDVKRCHFCTKTIPVEAIKCMHCQEVVDRERYNAMRGDVPEALIGRPQKQAVRA